MASCDRHGPEPERYVVLLQKTESRLFRIRGYNVGEWARRIESNVGWTFFSGKDLEELHAEMMKYGIHGHYSSHLPRILEPLPQDYEFRYEIDSNVDREGHTLEHFQDIFRLLTVIGRDQEFKDKISSAFKERLA